MPRDHNTFEIVLFHPWSHRHFVLTMSQDNGAPPVAPLPDAPPPSQAEMIVQMQQQHLEMQKTMTTLFAQLPSLLPAANPSSVGGRSRAKLTRPVIDADSTDNRWIIFKDEWSRYKEMAGLSSERDIRNELRAACSQKVNEMLFNFIGPDALLTTSENDLLGFIKSVAVKTVHPEVYRQHFYKLKQSDGETITSFISRLKAQAMLCGFNRSGTCGDNGCTPSYADEMIRSQLIAGLRHSSHRSKVLSEMELLTTLSQLTTRLLTLESTERASSVFQSPHQTTSDVSALKSKLSSHPPSNNNKTCIGCGKPFHPKGRSTCPAYGKTCRNCNKLNHFANVCRSPKSKTSAIEMPPDESAEFLLSAVDTASPL